MIFEEKFVYGSVATDVGVLQAIAREPAGEQSRDGALDAIVLIPVDELVSDPEQGAVTGTLCVARAVEVDDVLVTPTSSMASRFTLAQSSA